MPKRRKPFTRIRNPRKLIPTEATTRLLLGIYYHEGILSQTQIVREFFPGKTKSWPEYRLQHYFDHHLLNKFNAEWVNGEHPRETVYTLGTQGARFVAHQLEIDFTSLTWRSKPRWMTLSHDLKLNDLRFAITGQANKSEGFQLVRWISEFELHQNQKFKIPGRPDGFFLLRRKSPTQAGRVEELAILVEVDNATHPLGRFVSRKVKPALKFVGSERYKQIFGIGSGAYFVVTTGQKRLANLKEKTEAAGGNGLFYFTTFDEAQKDVLTAPIWQMAGSNERLAIKDMPLKPRISRSVDNPTQRQILIPTLSA